MRLTLVAKENLTADTRSYTFKPDHALYFEPGQFVQLRQIDAPKKNARAFSMACAPGSDTVTFAMKYLPDGHVSGFLETAPLGAQLEADLPQGRFQLNPADTTRVFVATGTGLAPIVSFIESGAHAQILFGARDEASLFWTEKLPPNALITLSRANETWTGLRGRVTDHLPPLIEKNKDAAWYICGNPEMVKDVRAQLLSVGITSAAIHFEIY